MYNDNYIKDRFVNLSKYSKFKKSEEIFPNEVKEYLLRRAIKIQEDGFITFVCAAGLEMLPVIVAAGPHTFKRYSDRFNNSYSEILMSDIIKIIENNKELAERLLDAEDTAFSKGNKFAMVAMYIAQMDMFVYLHISNGVIVIATAIDGKKYYYVNEDADEFVYIKNEDNIIYGIENIPFFKVSKGNYEREKLPR